MGKAGFSKGQLYAQNNQAGKVTMTLTDATYDTTSITFAKVMNSAPVVIPAINSDVDAKAVAYSITKTGFTVKVFAANTVTGECVVGYHAYDDRYR
jgi:hypothetical protein